MLTYPEKMTDIIVDGETRERWYWRGQVSRTCTKYLLLIHYGLLVVHITHQKGN